MKKKLDNATFLEINNILEQHLYLTQDDKPAIGQKCIQKIFDLILDTVWEDNGLVREVNFGKEVDKRIEKHYREKS
ncbi:MAG: hypothetical protein KKH44_07785 [Bacteroidetes bacterium]|nr:hypothetical protein [Bacteroidota bacterium]